MRADALKEARLLIVDDQEANVRLLKQILKLAGYTRLEATTDSREVLPLCATFQPDLILLDLQMPYLDGFQVMEALRETVPPETYLPILVLTADVTPETKLKALAAGARDFLTKPFDVAE